MHVRQLAAVTATVVSLTACAPFAGAAPLTFQLTGTVSEIGAGSPSLGAPWSTSGATVGSAATLTYTFEATTPDSDPTGSLGSYANAVSSTTLTINGTTQTSATPASISVFNNFPLGTDQYQASFSGFSGAASLDLLFYDANNASFATDALPTTLNLANFAIRQADLVTGNPFGQYIRLQLDSIQVFVPEPTTLGAAAAIGAVALRRRRAC